MNDLKIWIRTCAVDQCIYVSKPQYIVEQFGKARKAASFLAIVHASLENVWLVIKLFSNLRLIVELFEVLRSFSSFDPAGSKSTSPRWLARPVRFFPALFFPTDVRPPRGSHQQAPCGCALLRSKFPEQKASRLRLPTCR